MMWALVIILFLPGLIFRNYFANTTFCIFALINLPIIHRSSTYRYIHLVQMGQDKV